MDIRKISLELSGKLPPNYKGQNILMVMEILREQCNLSYEQLKFYKDQADNIDEEFYFLVFDYLQRKAEKDEVEKTRLNNVMKQLELGISDSKSLILKEKYKNEEEFTKMFLLPFFKELGYHDVRYTHGVDESGRDIVMKKRNELGEYRYVGVQAKYGNIDARSGNTSGVTTIIDQAKKCFTNEYEDSETNRRVRIAEYFIAVSGKITSQAVTEIMNIDPAYFKNNIHFLDREKIENMLLEINNT
ncbi:MAG: hypothetical protein PHU61_04310 [Candidatus Absconditabacteria bacterium]|nr:hypothetical protein [Candidatus Absconditabacteria bacterium]MDD3868805.1 hypothetical protein [Candidatus Absconditabacteria bacterium]MDD4713868.1 hypothetical protein [Candidatus Absconditabacteria bacterium]